MNADGGVYTNYKDMPSSGGITRGHSTLAESQGLIMLYAVSAGDRTLFEKTWGYVQKKMLSRTGLVAWRVDNGTAATSNSSIDDLRIASALCKASQKFGNSEYLNAADSISGALLSRCVKSSRLAQYCDFYGNIAQDGRICYLDTAAMCSLAGLDTRWNTVRSASLAVIHKAAVNETMPFYSDTFNLSTGNISSQNSYDMVNSLLVEYYLSEDGKTDAGHIKWLLQQCDGEGICASYNADGKAVSSTQSTAIYALTMLIAHNANNAELYSAAQQKMDSFMVRDHNSPIYGAFGDKNSLSVYSFDNLLALRALLSK